MIKIATLNTWNGLNGSGTLAFGTLETPSEHTNRIDTQLQTLKQLNADVVLLQELNPLPSQFKKYCNFLNKEGVSAVANAGIKIGYGLPINLNEGLGILYPKHWTAIPLGSKKLSGHFSFAPLTVAFAYSPFLSFQLHEARKALAVRLVPEGTKQSILVITLHLHHSPALTQKNDQIIQNKVQTQKLTDAQKTIIKNDFTRANNRRLSEIQNLLQWINAIRLPDETLIVGGDFNCEADSQPLQLLQKAGWQDLWKTLQTQHSGYTWEPECNPLAMRSQSFVHSNQGNTEIEDVYKQADAYARRIDMIYLHSKLYRPEQISIFGQQHPFVSDHYGVTASII